MGFVLFAFFNVVWATLYLESWKRRSAEISYRWGTADQRNELLAEPRPLFKVGGSKETILYVQRLAGRQRERETYTRAYLHTAQQTKYAFLSTFSRRLI